MTSEPRCPNVCCPQCAAPLEALEARLAEQERSMATLRLAVAQLLGRTADAWQAGAQGLLRVAEDRRPL